jgi:hypothetical protein
MAIDIEKLSTEHKGRNVVYTDGVGNTEEGHITSWNDTFIFVDYGNNCGRGIATSPEDLEFSVGGY